MDQVVKKTETRYEKHYGIMCEFVPAGINRRDNLR